MFKNWGIISYYKLLQGNQIINTNNKANKFITSLKKIILNYYLLTLALKEFILNISSIITLIILLISFYKNN